MEKPIKDKGVLEFEALGKSIAYMSDQAQSCVNDCWADTQCYGVAVFECADHWSCGCRSLELRMVMHMYGSIRWRAYIYNHCDLAKHYEELLGIDSRFEANS